MDKLLTLLNQNLAGGWYYSNSAIIFFLGSLFVNIWLVWLCILIIPKRFIDAKKGKRQRLGVFAFFYSISVVIPIVGVIFTLICVILIRLQPDVTIKRITHRSKYPVFRQEKFDAGRFYGEGGAYSLVFNDKIAISQRLRSLMNLNAMPSKLSQSINRQILQKKNDDVLLYAYVLTEKKRENIDKDLHHLKIMKKKLTNPARLALFNKWIAECCWEYVYFNLLDGVSSQKMVDHAFSAIDQSLVDIKTLSGSYILLGQLYKHKKEYHEAEKAFQKAIELGASVSQTIPYLIELAYIERDFQKIRNYLKNVHFYNDNEFLKFSHLFWIRN